MKKILSVLLLFVILLSIVGCTQEPVERNTGGTQDEIFDTISDAIKEVFDKP